MTAASLTLDFDPPTATDTRDASFRQVQSDESLPARRRAVLNAIRAYGPISDRMLAVELGVAVNRITGRRSELAAAGQIYRAGTMFDAETNRRVAVWGVREG